MTRELTLGISALHFQWSGLEEAFARSRDEYGVDLIEFSTNGDLLNHRPDDVRRLAETSGVQLSIHAWEDLAQVGPVHGERMCRYWLDYCTAIGARWCVMHMGSHEDRAYGLQTVAAIAEAAAPAWEGRGVTLVLENHYPYEYQGCNELGGIPEDCSFLLGIESPGVRFCLDTGHANMSCGTLPFIQGLGPVLAYVHITDNEGRHDQHIGYRQGTIDWDATLGALLERGFDGPYVIEFPEGLGIEHQHRFISDMRRLGSARVARQGG